MKLLLEHVPASLAIGLMGWWLSGDWVCLLAALATGWLIDVDHLADFVLYLKRSGRSSDWRLIKNGAYFKLNGKVLVPLHAWELTVALIVTAIIWPEQFWVWISAAASQAIHLRQDKRAYRVRKHGYWLTSRAAQGFSHEGFCR